MNQNALLLIVVLQAGNVMANDLMPTHKGVSYASVAGTELKLDLYLPRDVKHPKLLVWIHGGA